MDPAVDREQEIRKRSQDATESFRVTGKEIECSAAKKHVNEHHQQKKRIETREPRPQKSRDAAQPPLSHQASIIVMDHKAAEHEKQGHAKSGDLTNPINDAPRRLMGLQDPRETVPDKHGEGSNEAQACERGYVLSACFVAGLAGGNVLSYREFALLHFLQSPGPSKFLDRVRNHSSLWRWCR